MPFREPLQLAVDCRRRVALFEVSTTATGDSDVDLRAAVPIMDREAILRQQPLVQAATARGIVIKGMPVCMLGALATTGDTPQPATAAASRKRGRSEDPKEQPPDEPEQPEPGHSCRGCPCCLCPQCTGEDPLHHLQPAREH
jgi:hypothetical protein